MTTNPISRTIKQTIFCCTFSIALLIPLIAFTDERLESKFSLELVDPMFAPVAVTWLNQLSEDLPMFYSSMIREESLVTKNAIGSTPFSWLSGRFMPTQIATTKVTPIQFGPNGIRIKRYPNGKPMVQTHKPLFKGQTTVMVTFELGIFGKVADDLKNIQDLGFPVKTIDVSEAQISPISPEWADELKLNEAETTEHSNLPHNMSLYEGFEELESYGRPVNEKPGEWVMWTTTVKLTLSPAGKALLKRTLRAGFFSFPVVIKPKLSVFRGETNVTVLPALNPAERPAIKSTIEMAVPGGLACLTRNFWGKVRTRSNSDCAQYWVE